MNAGVDVEDLSPREQFLYLGAVWAGSLPESDWTPGDPPMVNELGFFVAVKTKSGRILTGPLKGFAEYGHLLALPGSEKYGEIVAWVPLGEPS
jgi:hypothetical protein